MTTNGSGEETEQADRFQWPDEVEVPDGLDGWEEMYPKYSGFGRTEERTEYEREYFWFWDKNHSNEPVRPWDMTVNAQAWQIAIGQNPSRLFAIPPAMSLEMRVIGGYIYWAAIPCEDEELIEEREEIFTERSQYVYKNYDGLFDGVWKPDVKRIGREIDDLHIPDELPKYVPEEAVIESKGGSQDTLDIMQNYNRLTELVLEGYQRHFEFLHLAYLAYLSFRETCDELFPGISEDTIGKMVSGLEVDLFQPDRKLNDLARLAVDLGEEVVDVLTSDLSPDEKIERLEATENGEKFMERFNEVKDPWFHLSYGDGLHSHERSWIHDLEAPFDHLEAKIGRLQQGKEIGRDFDQLREERDALVEEYRSYLDTEAELKQFNQAYETCRGIYEYTEDHQFWIEHWLGTKIFDTMREFGDLLVTHGLLEDPDDIFLFTKFEVAELLEELCETWALGVDGFIPQYWKDEADERAAMIEAAREWTPPTYLGEPPEQVTDPLLIMLWGITTENVYNELEVESSEESSDSLEGFGSSSGTIKGTARVLSDTEELNELEDGEILVCPYTNPAWAPIFSRIAGAVTDDGGITSHAAIVCREYSVPAVTGTTRATTKISTGDRIRVDGETGSVEILERA